MVRVVIPFHFVTCSFCTYFLRRDKKAAVAFTYGDTQTVQGKYAETDDSDDEDEIVDSDEFGRYFPTFAVLN